MAVPAVALIALEERVKAGAKSAAVTVIAKVVVAAGAVALVAVIV